VAKRVGVADLKAHLSEYLAEVRAGETIVVCDRRTPIARIIPEIEDELRITKRATRLLEDLWKIRGVAPNVPVDVVELLRESRDQR
jgi:prevent-host-death family protein